MTKLIKTLGPQMVRLLIYREFLVFKLFWKVEWTVTDLMLKVLRKVLVM